VSAFKIVILAEDTAGPRGTVGEHGLAVWIEKAGHVVLFDTGQGLALRRNASIFELDLSRVEAIVVSHGHYDHTGGLRDALAMSPNAPFFLHPDALLPKYRSSALSSDGEIGIPELRETELGRAIVTREALQVLPGIWTTGEIPRLTAFEDTGGRFYRNPSCTVADPLLDDQALFSECPRGTVVVLGCAHAGVVNSLERVRQLSGTRKIHAILGGMHLLHASESRIEKTIEALEESEVEVLCPCHCTGTIAIQALRRRFGNRVLEGRTGTRFMFG
jgi:7,8-dihydropterin-6-yl-methyl-4-(beta-D-ribofuranosyl)aminobenzene 5'-phosphate synthase